MADIQDLVHLEQDFFDTGYKDGYAHGRIHGLIEGRALGCEKGYEIWEEIGFYEGFALTWKDAYDHKSSNGVDARLNQTQLSSKSLSHLRHILESVSRFPRVNPKYGSISHSSTLASVNGLDSSNSAPTPELEVDILTLLNNIRARYKAFCASLSVRGRVTGRSDVDVGMANGGEPYQEDHQTIERLKDPVWKIDVSKDIDIHEETNPTAHVKIVSGSKLDEMSF